LTYPEGYAVPGKSDSAAADFRLLPKAEMAIPSSSAHKPDDDETREVTNQ